ncbi:hypothetical protein J7F00_18885 [Streptomyces sp. ISL-21]|nr:hypothetical protein [Streptomyces sp. ISL-21]
MQALAHWLASSRRGCEATGLLRADPQRPSHGDFTSRDDLIDKLDSYIINRNETAKPFRWTYAGTPLKEAA